MKKTLGGDRLGSGNNMKVNLHNYGRSNNDLSYIWRSTMSAGTLVPFMCEIGLPGDSIDIDLTLFMNTHPTIGPLFGSGKVQLDVFGAPMRLYNGKLHNNALNIGMKMADIKLPVMNFEVPVLDPPILQGLDDIDNIHINPSSILNYLGLRGFGLPNANSINPERSFNGVPLLAYWDIYKQYYSNKMEEVGYVVHTASASAATNVTQIEIENVNGTLILPQAPAVTLTPINNLAFINVTTSAVQDFNSIYLKINGVYRRLTDIATLSNVNGFLTAWEYNWNKFGNVFADNWGYGDGTQLGSTIDLVEFPLENIDKMREAILNAANTTVAFDIFTGGSTPYNLLTEGGATFRSILGSQEGLGIKTYNSDLFNNWLSTEWIDGINGINAITAIDTSGGSFQIDTLMLSRKVYDMLNRIAVSGGTYDDWLDAVWTEDRYTRCESPMYMGGMTKELVFQEIVSNSESNSNSGSQPLGTLGGKGTLSKNQKGGRINIKCDEPMFIIGIISITPRIDYSQGNRFYMNWTSMDDLHKPALDNIGFQDLITEKMAWWTTFEDGANTNDWVQRSAGKQPSWMDYRTNYNRTYGNFAIKGNEDFMVLNRDYESEIILDQANIKDLTTYIDPRKMNKIFAQTSLDSQNFWAQIGVDIHGRRKITARLMPNL